MKKVEKPSDLVSGDRDMENEEDLSKDVKILSHCLELTNTVDTRRWNDLVTPFLKQMQSQMKSGKRERLVKRC